MNEEHYLIWKEHKRSYLLDILKLEKDLADHIIWWFDNIKGKKECALIQEQNPDFEYASDEEVFKYIDTVSCGAYWKVAREMNPDGYLNFDMMFAFYTPLIIKEYRAQNAK